MYGDHSSHVQGVLYTDGRGGDCAGCVEPGVKPVSHPPGAQMGMNNRVVCCDGADLVLALCRRKFMPFAKKTEHAQERWTTALRKCCKV